MVFHGLFAFVESKDDIRALIPNLGTEDVYQAGNWLGELEFAPGTYSLEGSIANFEILSLIR